MTGEPGMDSKELAGWRRFYRRHPFGLLRGDMQAWLVARNVLEGWSKGLRTPDRAALGMSRHRKVKPGRGMKTNLTPESLKALARSLGVPLTVKTAS